jgi:hypothetical protein
VLIVELVIGSENVAEIDELNATPVEALAGEVKETVGGIVSGAAPVVKVQVKLLASGLPARSCAAVVRVAVYCVLPTRLFKGTKVAVVPLAVTMPATGAPPDTGRSVKLVLFIVELLIASEKVTDMVAFSPTSVSSFAGDVSDTVGCVVSAIKGGSETVGAATKGVSTPPPPHPNRLIPASSERENRLIRNLASAVWSGEDIGVLP